MTEDLWKVLEHTNEWLRFADTKATGSLAASGVIGGLASNALLNDTQRLPASVLWFIIPGLAALLVASGLAVYVIIPRLRVGEPTSLIYYEHVARAYKGDPAAHEKDLLHLLGTEEALGTQLANQIWANATVARTKYLYSSWSLLALTVALVFLAVGTAIAALTYPK